jgi:ABC-type molybdate transport system substrate-binding protein
MVRRFMFAAASAALVMLAPIAGAKAAELKVLAGGSMTDSLREIGPQFERATGHELVFLFAGTGAVATTSCRMWKCWRTRSWATRSPTRS